MEKNEEYKSLEMLIDERMNEFSNKEITLIAKEYRKNNIISSCWIFAVILILAILCIIFSEGDLNLIIFAIFGIILTAIVLVASNFVLFKSFTDRDLVYKCIKKEIKETVPKVKRETMNRNNAVCLPETFEVSKEILISNIGWSKYTLFLDDKSKKFLFQKGKTFTKMYDFSDLINYEVYENGEKTISGRAGASVVGGALFGIGGAIAGGSMSRKINEKCSQLSICIRINDISNHQIQIEYIKNMSISKNEIRYKNAKDNIQNLCSVLEYIMNSSHTNNQKDISSTQKTAKEELQELKEMFDENLITVEEYELKRKKILDI